VETQLKKLPAGTQTFEIIRNGDYVYVDKTKYFVELIESGAGLVVQAEMHTDKGRADLIINYRGQIFIIEIKVAYKGESAADKAEEAYKQIFEKNYNAPYPKAICIGLAIDNEQRQITKIRVRDGLIVEHEASVQSCP
jgi:hypothetical protein